MRGLAARAGRIIIPACLFQPYFVLGAAPRLSLTDSVVVQGAIIRVDVSAETRLDTATGSFMKTSLPFIRTGEGSFYALAGVDLDTRPGTYTLTVKALGPEGKSETAAVKVKVRDASFPRQKLDLPPAQAFPDSAAQARIKREDRLRNRSWSSWAPGAFWTGPFSAPIQGEMDRFGSRRVINGVPRSPHTGADISAPEGTPVLAPQAGKVLLTGEFFFTGNSIYLDHGLGLIGMFFHLSRIDVAAGQIVEKGQVIGAVGQTGRATGLHLHWGVRWRNTRINPQSLLELKLD